MMVTSVGDLRRLGEICAYSRRLLLGVMDLVRLRAKEDVDIQYNVDTNVKYCGIVQELVRSRSFWLLSYIRSRQTRLVSAGKGLN